MSTKNKLIVHTGSTQESNHQSGTCRINLIQRINAPTKPNSNRIKPHSRGGKQMQFNVEKLFSQSSTINAK
jgi:hypothetical protein